MPGSRHCSCSQLNVWGVRTVPNYSRHDYPDRKNLTRNGWYFTAVKVPGKYAPYLHSNGRVGATTFPPRDSGDLLVPDNYRWEHSLPGPAVKYHPISGGEDDEDGDIYEGSRVAATRAIYVDGAQKYIAYVQTHGFENETSGDGSSWNWITIFDTKTAGDVRDWELDNYPYGGISFDDLGYAPQREPGYGINANFLPGNWSIGLQFLTTSTYTVDGNNDSWTVNRIPVGGGDQVQSISQVQSEHGGDYMILLPARRAYTKSANDPDEVWVIARKFDGTNWSLVTSRWQSKEQISGVDIARLSTAEIAAGHGILAPQAGVRPEVVCYNRVQIPGASSPVDLVIYTAGFQDPDDPDGALPRLFYFDGTTNHLLANSDDLDVTHRPTFITMLHDGRICYGSRLFLKVLGTDGWTYESTANDPFFLKGVMPLQFQILPNAKEIQLRGFAGDVTVAYEDYDITVDAIVYDGSRPASFLDDNNNTYTEQPLNWSFSYDGKIRIPHLYVWSPAETPNNRHIVGRAYQTENWDDNQLYEVDLNDGEPPPDLVTRSESLWLPAISGGRYLSGFSGTTNSADFDCVDDPDPRGLPAVGLY